MNKLLFANKLYRQLIDNEIRRLEEVTMSLYSCMDRETAKLNDYKDKYKVEITSRNSDDFIKNMNEEYWKYSEQFPNILGYLLLVKYYSFLEYTLRSICLTVQFYKPGITPVDKFGNQIRNKGKKSAKIVLYVEYLKNAGIVIIDRLSEWNEITKFINPIRNAIVHKDGYIWPKSKVYKELSVYIDEKKPDLDLANNYVKIEKGYILKFAKLIRAIFGELIFSWEKWCKQEGNERNFKCESQ